MKLLIITQKVDINDDLLGFFHAWIAEFAGHCEKVVVIALGIGEYDLPANVKVLSLGKERGAPKLEYLINFYRYIWKLRDDYDTVFVHMNKEYVVMGGLFWKLTGKKISLWYQHKKTSLGLKLAEILSNNILTASGESFKLKSEKVRYVGHGVDMKKFFPPAGRQAGGNFKIIYLGRISEIKNQKLLIEAFNILINNKNINGLAAELIGAPATSADKIYLNGLKSLVEKYGLSKNIIFTGSVPHNKIPGYLSSADLSVNLCPTGGLDKAVLESLALGVPAIALNKIFSGIFKDYEKYFILEKAEAGELAEKISAYKNLNGQEKIRLELLNRVKADYGLGKLIKKIIDILKK
ncbi:MAG: glycosyltransferase family 4 protein [Patescibacteria group bacterium]